MTLASARHGAAAVAPMLVGVIPFGLVAGATPVADGFGTGIAAGLSTVVFAGASQLAAADALADGASGLVAALAAWTINLRMLLYSASLAPLLSHEPLRRRLFAAYVLTDQAYAVSITRWTSPGTAEQRTPRLRLAYFLGAAMTLWCVWQVATLGGALLGAAVPEDLPLDFAVPLVFLVLLVPTVVDRPSVVAAVVGGVGAVVGAELGASHLSVIVGAVAGIVAGAFTDAFLAPPVEPEP